MRYLKRIISEDHVSYINPKVMTMIMCIRVAH